MQATRIKHPGCKKENYIKQEKEAIGIATEEIASTVPPGLLQGVPTPIPDDDDTIKLKREELIRAAEREEISNTPEQIRKENKKVITGNMRSTKGEKKNK